MTHTKASPKIFSESRLPALVAKVVGAGVALSMLNGCLLTSPYWNQEFESHTDEIPLQAWTTEKDKPVRFECATAYHGGLYPAYSDPTWVHVVTVTPQDQSLKDSDGNKVHGAGKKRVLPESCWRQDPGNELWYSAIRAVQGTGEDQKVYKTFDKIGLKCLGEETGGSTSWFGWMNKGCEKAYNNGDDVPFVIFRATS